jgi:hypothetical protein
MAEEMNDGIEDTLNLIVNTNRTKQEYEERTEGDNISNGEYPQELICKTKTTETLNHMKLAN